MASQANKLTFLPRANAVNAAGSEESLSVPALLEITKLSLMIFEELDIFRYIGK